VNQELRTAMVAKNQGLVAVIARKYARNSEEFADFMQEGNIGLIKAVDKFDPSRPTKFSTLAFPWINKYIKKAVAERGIVHIPHQIQYKNVKIQRMSNRVYARTGINLGNWSNLSESYQDLTGIDNSHSIEDPFKEVETKELHTRIQEAKNMLSDKEQRTIDMRMSGIGPKEAGESFGCSKQRANQIYNKAIKKLQAEII